MHIVLNNNRVVAQGGNYIAMGGVVIDTNTGVKYENATITECDRYPTDIGKTSYEYRNGEFYPCAGISVLWENTENIDRLEVGSTLQLRHGNYDFAIILLKPDSDGYFLSANQAIIPNGCSGKITFSSSGSARTVKLENDVLTTIATAQTNAGVPQIIYGVKI